MLLSQEAPIQYGLVVKICTIMTNRTYIILTVIQNNVLLY